MRVSFCRKQIGGSWPFFARYDRRRICFGIGSTAPNDILRVDSITKAVDTLGSVCQVLMIILLCILIHKERNKPKLPLIIAVVISCLLYFVSWVFYYCGFTNAFVILGLTIPPCLAFIFFAIARKNMIAIIPISVFTICHLIYGIVNFVI